jgi:PEP-CTERM motif
MRLVGGLLFVGLLATGVLAYGDTLVIDNFSCADSVTQTGFGATNSFVSCPGSLGGFRQDSIFINGFTGDFNTAKNSISTINSNPPTGAITGTIGNDLIGADIMIWGLKSGAYDLPNLDLTGDSIMVKIQSDSGGTLSVNLASSSTPTGDTLDYSATFPASSGFIDVLIPLTNPTVVGTGANVNDVTGIGLSIEVPGGDSWAIDGIEAVPEPSTVLLTGLCFLGVSTRSIWRRRLSRR